MFVTWILQLPFLFWKPLTIQKMKAQTVGGCFYSICYDCYDSLETGSTSGLARLKKNYQQRTQPARSSFTFNSSAVRAKVSCHTTNQTDSLENLVGHQSTAPKIIANSRVFIATAEHGFWSRRTILTVDMSWFFHINTIHISCAFSLLELLNWSFRPFTRSWTFLSSLVHSQ